MFFDGKEIGATPTSVKTAPETVSTTMRVRDFFSARPCR